MLIAESVQLDGGTVALILGLMLVAALIALAVVIGGMVAARRAGRGSSQARFVWLSLTAIEGLVAWQSFVGKMRPNQITAGVVVVMAVQAGVYFHARNAP